MGIRFIYTNDEFNVKFIEINQNLK